MNKTLLTEMHALLNEGSGDARTNAATTLSVAAIEMSKQVELMKAASKAFATAQSQLPTMLKATHEMTPAEAGDLTKLMSRLETTKTKLKKYVLYASDNAAEAGKLASALKEPGPSGRPGAEPPDEPVVAPEKPQKFAVGVVTLGTKKSEPSKPKPVTIAKPDFSANDWQLYTSEPLLKASAKKAAIGLNAAAAKALDYLETELPKVSQTDKKAINKVVYHAYAKIIEPVMSKYAKSGASDTEPRNFIQQHLSDWARAILHSSIEFYDLW